MIFAADDDLTGAGDFEMAPEAEIVVASDEHLLIHGAVRIVTGGAAFEHRVVFIDERAGLLRMAARAGLIGRREIQRAAFDGISLMWIMAIAAGYFARENRVRVGETHFATLLNVTLEARVGRLAGVDDRAAGAAGLHVNAGGTVTRFAAGIADFRFSEREATVSCAREMAHLFLVALGAFARSDKRRTRNVWRREHGAIHHDAGDQEQAPGGDAAEDERVFIQTRAEDHGEEV